MPIRSLVYYVNMVERMVRGKNIYGHTRIMIPTPHFAVFYNGAEEQPEVQYYKPSDSYAKPIDKPELDLTCVVYNINAGHNQDLLKKCKFLQDYMTFVDYVRDFLAKSDYTDNTLAIEQAIDQCIEEGVLRDFLVKHRGEVVHVTNLDYTFERQLMLEREENIRQGLEEGREQGLKQGREQGIQQGIQQGCDTLSDALVKLNSGMSDADIIASGVDENTLATAKATLALIK